MSATRSLNEDAPGPSEAAPVEIRLLGPLAMRQAGQDLPSPRTAKSAALLALLICEGAALSREGLTALLWEDSPPEKAGRSLRVALSDLRGLLGERIQADRRSVRFLPLPGDRIDLLGLAAWEAGASGAVEGLRAISALDEQDQLLAGTAFDDAPELSRWLAAERERWSMLWVRAMLALAEAAEGDGDSQAAERGLRAALRRAPEREGGQRQLMRLLARQGRFDEALAQYEASRAALLSGLDVAPEPETNALRERILAARGRSKAVLDTLPASATPFVGRERELEQVGGWLRDPNRKLISILGPGGAGKTRLSVEAARRSRDAYLDGVCFVALDGLDAGAPIENALAAAMGLGSSREGPREQVIQALAAREILLVLDNFEHLMEQVELCSALLSAAPGLNILVSSREALGLPGEQRLSLSGLSRPESSGQEADPDLHAAAALFAEAAGRIQPDFDPSQHAAALGAICRRVEGLPLALELAAAWLEVADCASIATTIERDVKRLEAMGAGFPARHASIQAVFDGSWDRLLPAERLAVARLSVFRGGFTLDAAQAVADLDALLLRGLVRKSMLSLQPDGRFRMHALLRQLAAERLASQPAIQGPVGSRHAEYFLAMVAREGALLFGSESRDAAARLADDLDNAVAAWQWALAFGRWRWIEQALEGGLRYFRLRGPYDQALELLDSAAIALENRVAGAEAEADVSDEQAVCDRVLGRVHSYRAYLHTRCGRRPEAEAAGEASMQLARKCDDIEIQAFTHWTFGAIRLIEGELESAEESFTAGIEAAERAGHVEWMAENRWQLAVIDYFRDALEPFEATAHDLLLLCAELDLRHLEGRVRESLASVLTRRGDHAGARAHLAEAQAISEAMEDRLGAINVLGTLAELALQAGELDEAARLATDAMVRALDIGAEEAALVMRWGLATIELAQGDIASANGRLQTCLEGARAGGYRYWEACALTSLAEAARLKGDLRAAEGWLAEAHPLWEEIGHAWGRAFVWQEAGTLAREQGDFQRAEEHLLLAIELAKEAADANRGLQLRLEMGRLMAARGDLVDARRSIELLRDEAAGCGAGLVAEECRILTRAWSLDPPS